MVLSFSLSKINHIMQPSNDSFLFVEKYRPKKIEDCILPKEVKKTMQDFVAKGQIPNMIFSGTAGTGKTTLARALCNELGADLLYVNASNESGIDSIRTKVVGFASIASFESNLKVIILDESDFLTANAQAALRAVIEEFSKSTRFVLTCNFKNRLIDPLHSRCSVFDFKIPDAERKDLTAQALKRTVDILKQEDISFEPPTVIALVKQFFPDMRKVLNELQRASSSGKVDAEALVSGTSYDELIASMKAKKFVDVRKWVARNPDLDHNELFRHFYDNMMDLFASKSVPVLILTLAQYQFYAASVVDQELNTMACLVEIMSQGEWK
jgi:DNA polymerase III delta prime subunit